jgi:hypothetical protein
MQQVAYWDGAFCCEPAMRGADDVLFDLHNVSIVTERPAIFSLICEPEKL